MIKYPKIKPLYRRDNETHALLFGEYSAPEVELCKDLVWQWYEKIDGTNIGVVWDGYHVSFQGRTERAEIPVNLLAALEERFSGQATEEMFEQKFGETTAILFGEGFGGKIQAAGKRYSQNEDFILFDVYMPDSDLWLSMDNVREISEYFHIQTVPLLFEGTIEQAVELVSTNNLKPKMSEEYLEGVVGRPLYELRDRRGNRLMVKIKGSMFKER